LVAWVTAVCWSVQRNRHCHCRFAFRLYLLWCSGCSTWREGGCRIVLYRVIPVSIYHDTTRSRDRIFALVGMRTSTVPHGSGQVDCTVGSATANSIDYRYNNTCKIRYGTRMVSVQWNVCANPVSTPLPRRLSFESAVGYLGHSCPLVYISQLPLPLSFRDPVVAAVVIWLHLGDRTCWRCS